MRTGAPASFRRDLVTQCVEREEPRTRSTGQCLSAPRAVGCDLLPHPHGVRRSPPPQTTACIERRAHRADERRVPGSERDLGSEPEPMRRSDHDVVAARTDDPHPEWRGEVERIRVLMPDPEE